MLGKDDIRDLMLRECDICLHLFEKVPAGGMDYRPTPGQRSTLELLRYLARCGIGGLRWAETNDVGAFGVEAVKAKSMPAEGFPEAMERQKGEIRAFFDGLTQEDLETRQVTTPLGQTLSLERAVVEMPLHWMVAYRMQLFLYAKQAGNEALWTANAWGGLDMERPAPAGSSS